MYKRNNFFHDRKKLKHTKSMKQQINFHEQKEETGNKMGQSCNFQFKPTQSLLLVNYGTNTSLIKNRQTVGESRHQTSHKRYRRDRLQMNSVHLRKTSFTFYTRTKKQTFGKHCYKGQLASEFQNSPFMHKLNSMQQQYLINYGREEYDQAAAVLIKTMNYAIDCKMTKVFLQTIKQIAEFYLSINKINFSIFYYNQTRICAFLLNQSEILIDSLIGCSVCCRRYQLYTEAIMFLKKGLECAWFHYKIQKELKLYDQIGKVYYMMGQVDKAAQLHSKYINAIQQSQNSPLRILSKQRMSKFYLQSEYKQYDQIGLIFLGHLTLPILSVKQLPVIEGIQQTLRSQFEINLKYFNQLSEFGRELSKIVRQKFFATQMKDPQTVSPDKYNENKKKKFDILDLKMKQYLKQLGIVKQQKVELKPKNLQYKQPLQQKVKNKLMQPGLDPHWQQKLVKQIKRDRHNKIFKIQSQIRVRGRNKAVRPQIQQIHKIFTSIYR